MIKDEEIKDEEENNCSDWWAEDNEPGRVHDQNVSSVIEKIGSLEHCMICGSPLEYLDHAIDLKCSNCDKIESGYVCCPYNHFVCESCHNYYQINSWQPD